MKKTFTILLSLLLAISLTGCEEESLRDIRADFDYEMGYRDYDGSRMYGWKEYEADVAEAEEWVDESPEEVTEASAEGVVTNEPSMEEPAGKAELTEIPPESAAGEAADDTSSSSSSGQETTSGNNDNSQSSQNSSDQNNSGQSESGQSNSGQSESGQSNADQSESGQSESGQSESGQSNADQNGSDQNNSGQSESNSQESGSNQNNDNSNQSNEGKYKVGERWEVDGQWSLIINSVLTTSDRDDSLSEQPAEVYIVDYTYRNIGYTNPDDGSGLIFWLDDGVTDSQGYMGYGYDLGMPYEPVEVGIGESYNAQICIAVDHSGPFDITVVEYDSNNNYQEGVFHIEP